MNIFPSNDTPSTDSDDLPATGIPENGSGIQPVSGLFERPHHTALPWSMQLMRPLAGICCQECGKNGISWSKTPSSRLKEFQTRKSMPLSDESDGKDAVSSSYDKFFQDYRPGTKPVISPHVLAPMSDSRVGASLATEQVMHEYVSACQFYGVPVNSGAMATFRFQIPSIRVSGRFHDADMMALSEILLRHINGPLSYIRRLDFSRASKEGKLHGKFGFRSHGALCLAKTLQISEHIQEVKMQRNRIGAFGAAAIFLAAAKNKSLHTLVMRRCRIGERGGMSFAEIVCPSTETGLREVDLSANHIGFRGSLAIENGLQQRDKTGHPLMIVDIEGNLVFQEVMNGITHGLGVLFAMVGAGLLSDRVNGKSNKHIVSCGIYSTSLLVLYTSSTLYHSFFTMQNTKYIFEVLDKCAIYILIAGSYTPFLQIVLSHNKMWSIGLLVFIWICCILGIAVEMTLPTWKHRTKFSLAMYLGMGWVSVVCLPEVVQILPQGALNLLVMGGVGYTSGVPFFVRNNNLDHSIWHIFVLSGSIFHWIGIYQYVATMDLS